jgi:uncharacterized membrane protein
MKRQPFNTCGKGPALSMEAKRWKLVVLLRRLWLIPILSLATLVRLYGSTASAIWCDEGSSLLISRYSPSLIWFHSAHDVHPPLYFLILHYWINAWGDGIFSLRFLSVLTGITTVPVGIWLVHLIATRRAAIMAGVLLALLPIAVRYSQEVRMYSLMGLLLLGATIALVYWVQKPERHRYPVIYGLLISAGLYTHYFSGLCVLSHWLYLALMRREKNALLLRPAWWITNSMIVLMYAPWIPNLIDLLQHGNELKAGGDIGWIPAVTLYSLPSTIWQYLTLGDGLDQYWLIYLSLPLTVLLVCVALCWRDQSPHKFHTLLVIYTLAPLLLTFLASWMVPVLVERYLMFSALGLPLVMAIVIDRIGRHYRYLAITAITAALVVESIGLRNDYQTDDQQFDTLVNYVNQSFKVNDRIVISDLFWYFGYVYYNKTGSQPQLYTPPQADGTSGRPGNYGFGTLVESDAKTLYLDRLQDLGAGPARVWLISSSELPDDFNPIPGNWVKLNDLKVGDTQARLYSIPAASVR